MHLVADLGLDNEYNGNQAGKTLASMQQLRDSSNTFVHPGDIF